MAEKPIKFVRRYSGNRCWGLQPHGWARHRLSARLHNMRMARLKAADSTLDGVIHDAFPTEQR